MSLSTFIRCCPCFHLFNSTLVVHYAVQALYLEKSFLKICTKPDIQQRGGRKQQKKVTERSGAVYRELVEKMLWELGIGYTIFLWMQLMLLLHLIFVLFLKMTCRLYAWKYNIYSNIPQRLTNHIHKFCIMIMELATTICFRFLQN